MCNSTIVKFNELKKGDVLLFSHTDDWYSTMISLITNSPISHAAMSYYDYTSIVEEVPPCATVNPIKESSAGRQVTVMRINREYLDMGKVLEVAEQYVVDKAPYAKKNTAFIVLYILITKIPLPVTLQKLLLPLIKYVIADMINKINNKYFEGQHPMICSQFVYRCYEEAGDEYKLIMNDSKKGKTLLSQIQEYISNNRLNLEHKLVSDFKNIEFDENHLVIDEEATLKEIYEALKKQLDLDAVGLTKAFDEEFVIATHEFCTVLHNLYNPENNSGALIKSEKNLKSVAINSLMDVEEYFVFPGDLLNKCTNLINIGILGD